MAPVISASKPTFPSYLVPSFRLPFRRRRQTTTSATSDVPSLSSSPDSSASSSLSASPTSSSAPVYFDAVAHDKVSQFDRSSPRRLSRATPDTLRCSTCSSDIAFASQIVSKGFTGRYGRAFLVSPPPPSASPDTAAGPPPSRDLINIRIGRSEDRQLVTGWHVVADINCAICGVKLGWKYVDAREVAQHYKIGKFILETERVVGFRSWEDVDAIIGFEEEDVVRGGNKGEASGADEVAFDSDDEDECEDIFAGTWDPVVVAQRRSRKVSRRKASEA
ncbi:yippee family protein [Plectosphaerella cucumerina]|uniref:Yippee family protein n=1 Tax=Plectosphaerella cucumerina TaxID=40658 RepID=A0A8K0X1Q7_9PEZI|nr:yippee family protein [Plectosphaerella cucumerina]